jgi:hypothetical protein
MKKKTKRYQDGGDVIELQSKTGKNEAISDETRAKAMASVSKSDGESEDTKYAKKLYNLETSDVPKKTAEKLTPAPKKAMDQITAAPKKEDQITAAPKKKESSFKDAPTTFKKGTSSFRESPSISKDTPATFKETPATFKDSSSAFKKGTSSFKEGTSSFKKMARGGKVSSASKRADGCAIRGKTRA